MEVTELTLASNDPAVVREALALSRRLQVVSERLAEARTPSEVLKAVLGVGLEATGAVRALIAVLDPADETLEIVASHGYPDELMREWQRFPLSDDLPLSRALLRREPVFIGSESERDALFPAFAGRSSEPTHAVACLPLLVEGRPTGGMTLSFAHDEDFSVERRRFKVALAHQVAQALERTRLFEAEQRLRRRMTFLADAGYALSASLDYHATLNEVARLAVPDLADWCTVDMLSDDARRIERLALAHVDPAMVRWAQELGERYPPDPDSPYGVAAAVRTGEPQFLPEIDDTLLAAVSDGDEELFALLRQLELRSVITVPLVARGRALGGLSLIRCGRSSAYTQDDLELALELGLRAGQAVDNALLLRQVQRQADAARALAYVADAVAMVDKSGTIAYWNGAAERLTGVRAEDAVGGAGERIPGWPELVARVPVEESPPTTVLPLTVAGSERWLAVRAAGFDDGVVYALREVTGEHELERLRADFVATASHELRTPLAAVYGAIRSLRRNDIDIAPEQREAFLEMIEREAERLRTLVDQLLVASRLDTEFVDVVLQPIELAPLVGALVQSTQIFAPDGISFRAAIDQTIRVLADPQLLRQVLGNIVDNAVKYSPDGGTIEIGARRDATRVFITVSDHGIGIPLDSQARIFEKFFRVDPDLRRGIGGTGLGLYIAAELTARMNGRTYVDSTPGAGSTFTIELPAP